MKPLIFNGWDAENFCANSKKTTQLIFVDTVHFEDIEAFVYATVSKDEIEKAGRFFQKKDRTSYLMGKYTLRLLLSKIEIIAPTAVRFSSSANKKPLFKSHEFNITHTGNHIYLAFSPSAVGIDAEKINVDFDMLPIVESCFSFEERALYLADNSRAIFYKIWTRKEALLKATGEGICNEMKEVSVLGELVNRNGKKYRITTRTHEDYIISMATLHENEQPIYLNFDRLAFS